MHVFVYQLFLVFPLIIKLSLFTPCFFFATDVMYPDPNYCAYAIITRSCFETLIYKPLLLDPKIEEFLCSVHKLSVTLTALQHKPQ